jgi:hypothetical protein
LLSRRAQLAEPYKPITQMPLPLDQFFEIWSAQYAPWRDYHLKSASPESPHTLVWHDGWMAGALARLNKSDTPKRRDDLMRKRHNGRTAVHDNWKRNDAFRRRLRSASDANPDAAADAAANRPTDAPPDADDAAAALANPDAASNATVAVPPDVARQLALFRLAMQLVNTDVARTMQLVNTASNATANAPPGAPHAPHAPPDAPHPPATGQPGVLHPPATGRLSKATRNRQRRRKAVNTARIWHAAGV